MKRFVAIRIKDPNVGDIILLDGGYQEVIQKNVEGILIKGRNGEYSHLIKDEYFLVMQEYTTDLDIREMFRSFKEGDLITVEVRDFNQISMNIDLILTTRILKFIDIEIKNTTECYILSSFEYFSSPFISKSEFWPFRHGVDFPSLFLEDSYNDRNPVLIIIGESTKKEIDIFNKEKNTYESNHIK